MSHEQDSEVSTARRHPDDTLYDVFYEIEAYCKLHHFTIFYGGMEEEVGPQPMWDLEEDPRWEHFIDVAESLAVRVIYLNRSTFSSEHLATAVSQLRRRTDQKKFSGEFECTIGMTMYIEVAFIYEGFLHTYLCPSTWYKKFSGMFAVAPIKHDDKDSASS